MKLISPKKSNMKYVVLLSAGLDSATNLFAAHRFGEVLLALTFDYGQRAAKREIESAQKLTSILKINHKVIDLSWFSEFKKSSLIDRNKEVPIGSQISIDDLEVSKKSAKSVWVPNRNGIFLNIAAGFAEDLECQSIIPGFNLEEAKTFPDNSMEFMNISTEAFTYSTSNHVKVECFTQNLNKTEIVSMAMELGVPFKSLWPCYFSNEKWCGQCESCLRAYRAFEVHKLNVRDCFENTIY